MSEPDQKVTFVNGLSEFAQFASWLKKRGLLVEISERLELVRSRGYSGIDVFMVLFGYLCTVGEFRGMRGFCADVRRRCGKDGVAVAAMMDRERWPTQASMSRALGAVPDTVPVFVEWLMSTSIDVSLGLHESCLHRDALGEAWHVFSYDPTIEALRRRALPEGEEFPEAQRRTDGFAAPGHMGRKRGEAKISRGVLQHRGTGMFHWISLAPGGSDLRADLTEVTRHLSAWSKSVGVERERCIVVVDGEGGGHTQVDVLGESVSYVTRSTEYKLLVSHLKGQPSLQWSPVEDSCSGPTREAAEFGTIDKYGRAIRLVVSRFKSSRTQKRGAGKLIGTYQYEMYATNLDTRAWPASDVVTLYYGRTGLENHFALEDKYLNTWHIFSHQLPAQMLAFGIGMFLWNLRILLGVDAVGGLAAIPVPAKLRPAEPEKDHTETDDEARKIDETSVNTLTACDEAEKIDETRATKLAADVTNQATEVDDAEALNAWAVAQLPDVDWMLPESWHFDSEKSALVCERGRYLNFYTARTRIHGAVEARFRALRSDCADCPFRATCTSNPKPSFQKEKTVTIRTTTIPAPREIGLPARLRPPQPSAPGPYQIRYPYLVVTALMHATRTTMRDQTITVAVWCPPAEPRTPHYYALTAADRQHRRRTKAQRLAWNAISSLARATIHGLPERQQEKHAA